MIGMFFRYLIFGRSCYKGFFCVVGKWVGNKIGLDFVELGMVEGERVGEGGGYTGVRGCCSEDVCASEVSKRGFLGDLRR